MRVFQIPRNSDFLENNIRYLFFITALLIPNFCFGQFDTISKTNNSAIFGINAGSLITISSKILDSYAGTAYTREKDHLNFCAHLSIEKGKSFFAAGVILSPHLEKSDHTDYKKNYGAYRLNGFDLIYQFILNPTAKKYNSFFQIQFIQLFHKNTGKIDIWIPYSYPNPKQGHYTSNWRVKYFFIGYGLKVRLLKNLYISPSVSLGGVVNRENIYYEPQGLPQNSSYSDGFTSLSTSLLVEYKFNNKKR